MNFHRFSFYLAISMLALGRAFGSEETPWEKYIAYPSPENAALVRSLQYSEQMDTKNSGEKITADLRVLAVQVLSGDGESFRVTLRIISSTKPGANFEYLLEVAGRYLRQNPRAYLEDIQSFGSFKKCPGVNFVGDEYTDRDSARSYETSARIKALESIHDNSVEKIRDRCLSQLKKD